MSGQTSSSDSQPSMIAGHVKYVQGVVSSALGYETGDQTKQEAVKEMKEASEASKDAPPAQSTLLGTIEKTVGQVTGCEGMVDEGKARIPPKAGLEETNGLG